jgi:2-hydroxychromene-2-carboxylate isomerase
MPPAHPFNPLVPLRLCVALGSTRASVEAIFDYIWGEGGDVSDADGIAPVAAGLGVEDVASACGTDRVKNELRTQTERAIAAGVYGVPTFEVDGQLFWGADLTDMLLDYLNDPRLFEESEMRRIAGTPIGQARPQSR